MVQRTIETALLVVLIGLVALRPLVKESYDSARSSLTAAIEQVRDPSPAATLLFDVIILGAAGACFLVPRLGSQRRYRWTGLEPGLVLVAIAAVISCAAAGNKRLALNASIDWLCYPVLTIALVQLLRERVHQRLILAAVLASAYVQAAQCFEQSFDTFDATWDHYQNIKADHWAKQGVELDSSTVEAFEGRMLAREAAGFFAHSNVAGSYLMLGGFAALGATITGWKLATSASARVVAVAATLATLAIFGAVALTKSLGAMLSTGAGLGGWLLLRGFQAWIDSHRRKAILIGCGTALVGIAAVVGHGLCFNSLPGTSLTFRWQYWTASAQLVANHPLTGVGRENFGRHYLKHKAIESPEEVANPHNLFVQAAADWGIPGLVGALVMMVGGSLAVAGGRWRRGESCQDGEREPPPTSPLHSYDDHSQRGTPPSNSLRGYLPWAVALLLVVTLGRIPLLGTDDIHFVYYHTVTTGLTWVIGFGVFAALLNPDDGGARARGGRRIDSDRRASASVSATYLSSVTTGTAVGLFAFLLHDMINFAMFMPGAATTFFALLGCCIAERFSYNGGSNAVSRNGAAAKAVRGAGAVWLVATSLGFGVALSTLVVVSQAQNHLARARNATRLPATEPLHLHPAYQQFETAARIDPRDPTPYVEQAQWMWQFAALNTGSRITALREAADQTLDRAMRRDPHSHQLARMRTQVYLALAEQTRDPGDFLKAVRFARNALALYPLSPADWVSLADVQLAAGEALASQTLLRDAVESYSRAIALDDQRLSWETLRRFRPKDIQSIQRKIDHARTLVESP